MAEVINVTPAIATTGLAGAVRLVVRLFLEEKHFANLHRILSDQWKSCHSLTAAIKLMEAHGVHISVEDEKRFKNLSEDQMIDQLVHRMPGHSREQFEHFFLQLSLIASTTTRLRTALELGKPAIIEEALESAENVGILNYLLKMAVVQAGSEVTSKEDENERWIASTEKKLGPLLTAQAEATELTKKLEEVKTKLDSQRMEASEKTKKVLAGLASGSDGALKTMAFINWQQVTAKQKRENEIGKEYEAEIQAAMKRLTDYRSKQLEIIRNVLLRDVEKNKEELMAFIFAQFQAEVEAARAEKANDEQVKALQSKLSQFSDSTAANAKKVLTRMNAGSDEGLVRIVWQGFLSYHGWYQQNKEIEDMVKAKEKQLKEYLSTRNAGQFNVIRRLCDDTAQGLLTTIVYEWKKQSDEQKQADKAQEELEAKMDKLGLFGVKNKGAAMTACDRMANLTEHGCLIVVISHWKRFAKIERMRRYGSEKNNKKKAQIKGVKDMFKGFAQELDAGLREGTPRIEPPPKR